MIDLFKWETLWIKEPEVIDVIDYEDTSLSTQVDSEDDLKRKALKEARDTLSDCGVDLKYIIKWLKNVADTAVLESFQWNILEDYKTKAGALKQLWDLWKTANGVNKKDPQEIVFKPIFDKPPKLC